MVEGLLRDFVAALGRFERELNEVGFLFGELKARADERVWLFLPRVPVRVEYAVDLELPEELALLACPFLEAVESFPRRARRVAVGIDVREKVGLYVAVEGEDGTVHQLDPETLGGLAATILLWDLLRRHGVDFLADLRRELEGRREKLLRLKTQLEQLGALLGVATA
ncbi:MAG: hypothetical protein QXJ59_06170 [Thermofilaceae archaeon]